jgi:RHS repeat-associated protein
MREVWTHLPDGRWIERIVSTNNGSAYYPAFTNRFIWDGQVLMAILNHTNGLVMSFVRGLDLSGSVQGAGGVGGVLAVNFAPSILNAQPSTHLVSYDGNGNVVAMADASNGNSSGQFEYGPFSESIRVTGTAAAQMMPLRFSTMYEDSVTGDRKYLFRDLNPSTGRWKSRDPIAEKGGKNVYGACGNDCANAFDLFGLYIELWYGNHHVARERRHSKLWLITDEPEFASTGRYAFGFLPALSKNVSLPSGFIGPACVWFVSIGAGPEQGELIARFNRPSDVALMLQNPSMVTSFSATDDAFAFLDQVVRFNVTMNRNFMNTSLEYEFEPGPSYTAWDQWDEFNSNSYISGLLIALGYQPPIPGPRVDRLPGYSKPVPFFVFQQSFSSTSALKLEWKRHYPGLK